MRLYQVCDTAMGLSNWWAASFTHAVEQFEDAWDEGAVSVTCVTLLAGQEHDDLWDWVYDHVIHFGAIPVEFEDAEGRVWSTDEIICEMTEEEHLLVNAMIRSGEVQ